MAMTTYVLYFNAFIWFFFGLPHIFAADGNMATMGFTPAAFLPKKVAMPDEISLLLTHLCAILGSAQVAIGIMCLLAAMGSSKEAKKLALQGTIFYFIVALAMQFYKPAGTGADGSPATGPLPLLIGLMLPSFAAMVM